MRGGTAAIPGSRMTSKVIGQKKLGRALVPVDMVQKGRIHNCHLGSATKRCPRDSGFRGARRAPQHRGRQNDMRRCPQGGRHGEPDFARPRRSRCFVWSDEENRQTTPQIQHPPPSLEPLPNKPPATSDPYVRRERGLITIWGGGGPLVGRRISGKRLGKRRTPNWQSDNNGHGTVALGTRNRSKTTVG